MFYDRFIHLCKEKGVSPSRAAIDAGISKSLVTKWKTSHVQTPSPDVLRRLSKYFNVPISELISEETEKAPTSGERPISDDDIKFALFGGNGEITDAMYDEVRSFAAFVKRREEQKKKE